MLKNPRCPECGNKLVLSKIDFDLWVCKKCNSLYPDSEISDRENIKNFNIKKWNFN